MNARVFVPQQPHRWDASLGVSVPMMDLSPAIKYGDIKICLRPNISFAMSAPVVTALKEQMSDFTQDDYLIAIGSPMSIAISAGIAFRKTGGALKLLTWDKRERTYMLNEIKL